MAKNQPEKFLLTIKDLMRIRGLSRYNSAQEEHQTIRDALSDGKEKKYLTVQEYCTFETLPYDEVIAFLTGDAPHPENGLRNEAA